jgi:hypothetical protein
VNVVFVQKDNVPERMVSEAELVFTGGVLDGMKLVGFTLWRDPEGEVYVTFPSRAFGAGPERRYYDYLRTALVAGDQGSAKGVKAWILDEYRKQQAVRA